MIQQMQDFDWEQFEGLAWSFKNEQGKTQIMVMSDMIPPADTLAAFLSQCDRCNALAVKMSMGNSYGIVWQAQRQLETELSKAKNQASAIRLDTNKNFTDVEKSLGSSEFRDNKWFGENLRSMFDDYTALLDITIENIDKAEQLALKLRPLCIDPFAQNVP